MHLVDAVIIVILSCAFVLSSASISNAEEPHSETLAPKQILERMAKTYAECKSYRDSGIVKIVFIEHDGRNWTKELVFNTAFIRPDRFRFEYYERVCVNEREEKSLFIVWRKENEVRTWWDIKPGTENPPSLELAVAGATGVSGGSAHTIPALLLPNEISGRPLTDITEASRIEDAKLDETECFRVHGNFDDSPVTLWIEKETYLVRRIDEETKFEDFQTVDTTTYEPVVDGEIADNLLEYNPPNHK